jgi:hypothetical protein
MGCSRTNRLTDFVWTGFHFPLIWRFSVISAKQAFGFLSWKPRAYPGSRYDRVRSVSRLESQHSVFQHYVVTAAVASMKSIARANPPKFKEAVPTVPRPAKSVGQQGYRGAIFGRSGNRIAKTCRFETVAIDGEST